MMDILYEFERKIKGTSFLFKSCFSCAVLSYLRLAEGLHFYVITTPLFDLYFPVVFECGSVSDMAFQLVLASGLT